MSELNGHHPERKATPRPEPTRRLTVDLVDGNVILESVEPTDEELIAECGRRRIILSDYELTHDEHFDADSRILYLKRNGSFLVKEIPGEAPSVEMPLAATTVRIRPQTDEELIAECARRGIVVQAHWPSRPAEERQDGQRRRAERGRSPRPARA